MRHGQKHIKLILIPECLNFFLCKRGRLIQQNLSSSCTLKINTAFVPAHLCAGEMPEEQTATEMVTVAPTVLLIQCATFFFSCTAKCNIHTKQTT